MHVINIYTNIMYVLKSICVVWGRFSRPSEICWCRGGGGAPSSCARNRDRRRSRSARLTHGNRSNFPTTTRFGCSRGRDQAGVPAAVGTRPPTVPWSMRNVWAGMTVCSCDGGGGGVASVRMGSACVWARTISICGGGGGGAWAAPRTLPCNCAGVSGTRSSGSSCADRPTGSAISRRTICACVCAGGGDRNCRPPAPLRSVPPARGRPSTTSHRPAAARWAHRPSSGHHRRPSSAGAWPALRTGGRRLQMTACLPQRCSRGP